MAKLAEQTFNIGDDNLEQHIVTLFDKLECMRRDAIGLSDVGLCMPARLEVRTLSLWKAVVAECAASFLYVFIVCGAAGGAGVGASASAVLLATALASGCAIAVLTLCFVKISGAHVNPAVSAALCVRRKVSLLRAALYVAAQCGGAIAGAAAIYGVSTPGYTGSLSTSLPGLGGTSWERLGAELVLSALVAATYFAAMERRWTGSAPAMIGAAYCAASFVAMPSLNPARSLGPSFVLSRWESHWVCWVGGIGGGVACGLLHEWATRRPQANSASRASSPRDLDDLDKPTFPQHHYRHTATYCSASAPRPENAEPLYSGTKSLYCRSPPPARHALHRSQSVYSKGSPAGPGGPLLTAQSLLLRGTAGPGAGPLPVPHVPHGPLSTHAQHVVTHNQNAHNAQRDPAYGTATANGIRTLPAGAPVQERRDSLYGGTRRGPLSSEDSAYGTYSRNYRAPHSGPPEHY